MHTVGTVESLWRYPVKSMRGEQLEMAYAGFSGIYGNRIYAIHDATAQAGFPYLTAREQEKMLLFRPIFGDIQRSLKPDNQDEAAAISPNINPMYADPADLRVTVQAPNGETLKIDDPALISLLRRGLPERHQLRLVSSQRAMTDCRPLSIFSTQTAQKIGCEIGTSVDKRRFRANIYLDLSGDTGFAEDQFVGQTLRIGNKVVVAVLARDARCKIITLDPDTAVANPEVMKRVAREHDGKAGIYAAVLIDGTIHSGDEVVVLD